MKCPACGNEIADDAKHCPQCGKYISKKAPEFNAGETAAEPAAEPAAAESVSGSAERLCPCCQTPMKPGATFCGNCGASMDGQGGNPYAGNPYNGNVKSGRSGGSDSARALSVMNEMNNMLYWIAGYVIVTVLAQMFQFLTIGTLFAFTYILIKTPALADRCGEILENDSDLSPRIAKVRPRVKMLWILFAVQIVVTIVMIAGIVIGLVALNSNPNDMPAALIVGACVFGVFFLVSFIAILVYEILLLIDFFKVKEGVERAVKGY